MNERDQAEAWAEEQLANARRIVAEHPLGPRDQTWEQFERFTRGMVDAFLATTDDYLGLNLREAEALAKTRHERVCPHHGPTGHRADMTPQRIHVAFDDDGRITKARRDRPPWWVPTPADPDPWEIA